MSFEEIVYGQTQGHMDGHTMDDRQNVITKAHLVTIVIVELKTTAICFKIYKGYNSNQHAGITSLFKLLKVLHSFIMTKSCKFCIFMSFIWKKI